MDDSRQLVTDFIARINDAAAGSPAEPCALLASDVVVSVSGTTPISGVYRGKNQVMNVLLPTTAVRMKKIRVEIKEFVGAAERIAALLIVTGESAQGKSYNDGKDTSGAVFGTKNGEIVDIRLFPDTTLIETVLFNNVYVSNDKE